MQKPSLWKAILLLCLWCAVTGVSSPAQTFTTLYSFCSQTNCTDGLAPYAPLIQGTDANFYGTTETGGTNSHCTSGIYVAPCGTVFKITPTGTVTTLYSFCAQTGCTDGQNPETSLVLAANGSFYGATYDGGNNGYGTVFKITPSGTFTELHSFCSQANCPDGAFLYARLVQATNGSLYGATYAGGKNLNCVLGALSFGCGTIFKISAAGALTTLYSFCAVSGCPDGQFPVAGLIQGADGNLYGATPAGGAYGQGTIFKVTLAGALTTLYSFCSGGSPCSDGSEPGNGSGGAAGLTQGSDGNFYGTTVSGGACNFGTVFKITRVGKLTTLHSFGCQSGQDGQDPNAGLFQGTDGNFYGTTTAGGNGAFGAGGTIFEITTGGALTTLYSFCSLANCTDGAYPTGLFEATNGSFYGTTDVGGANNRGTAFSLALSPPLGAFVETNPTSGKVGTKVTILGNGLAGSTGVTFNGTPATSFTVNSTGTAITTAVPTGATTGSVQVTTAGGATLTSNLKFTVP